MIDVDNPATPPRFYRHPFFALLAEALGTVSPATRRGRPLSDHDAERQERAFHKNLDALIAVMVADNLVGQIGRASDLPSLETVLRLSQPDRRRVFLIWIQLMGFDTNDQISSALCLSPRTVARIISPPPGYPFGRISDQTMKIMWLLYERYEAALTAAAKIGPRPR